MLTCCLRGRSGSMLWALRQDAAGWHAFEILEFQTQLRTSERWITRPNIHRERRMKLRTAACTGATLALLTGCSGFQEPPRSIAVDQLVSSSARGNVAMHQPLREAVLSNGECRVEDPRDSEVRAVSAIFPNRAEPETSIMLELDGDGRLIRYRETRGIPRPASTIEEMQQQTTMMARTQIQLDFTTGQGLMLNFEPGQPTRSVTGMNAEFQRPPFLDDFEERVATVRKLCSA